MADITIGIMPPLPNNPGKRDRQGRESKEKRKKEAEKRRQNSHGIVVTISNPADRGPKNDCY